MAVKQKTTRRLPLRKKKNVEDLSANIGVNCSLIFTYSSSRLFKSAKTPSGREEIAFEESFLGKIYR